MVATLRLPAVTDDDLLRLSAENPGWSIERDETGAIVVSPTTSDDGAKSGEAFMQLALYCRSVGGRVFDSSTGFKMPTGAVVSPDASWLSGSSLASLAAERRSQFWQIVPDVVVEVRSESDSWSRVQRKVSEYLANGARYAVGIDPQRRDVFVLGAAPAGLAFDFERIFDA